MRLLFASTKVLQTLLSSADVRDAVVAAACCCCMSMSIVVFKPCKVESHLFPRFFRLASSVSTPDFWDSNVSNRALVVERSLSRLASRLATSSIAEARGEENGPYTQ